MIHNRNLVVDVSPPSCWSVDRVHFFEWSVELPRIGWKLVRVALSTGCRDTVRERRSNLEMEVSKYNKYLRGKRIPVQFGRNYDSFAPYLPVYRGKLLLPPYRPRRRISAFSNYIQYLNIPNPNYKSFFVTRPHFDSRQLFSSSSNKFTRFVNNVHIFPPPRSNSILRDPIIAVTRTFFRRKINFSHPLEDATCDPSKLFPPTDNAFIVSEEHRGWKNRSKTRKTGFFGVTRADDARGSSNGKKALFFFCSLSIVSLLISLGIFQLV